VIGKQAAMRAAGIAGKSAPASAMPSFD